MCFGESYKFNNVFLTAGTWDYFFKNKYGCDSNITVVVEELELLETHLDTFLCFPDSLKFGQRNLIVQVFTNCFSLLNKLPFAILPYLSI
ncbi:MAG: hypothetical protein IPO78_16230 [Saprospiraceae bacterium]|nr:hypothetical protein [Saprospiraceae bacterium]